MLGPEICQTSESAAQLPAELEVQTLLHSMKKEILPCLGMWW